MLRALRLVEERRPVRRMFTIEGQLGLLLLGCGEGLLRKV